MYRNLYQSKTTTIEDELSRIQSNSVVYCSSSSGHPIDFASKLPSIADRVRNVILLNLSGLPAGAMEDANCKNAFQIYSAFYTPFQRASDPTGMSAYLPAHFRNTSRDWLTAYPELDLAVITVSPMDQHGYFTTPCNALLNLDMIQHAKRVVVEVVSGAPRIFGDVLIHVSQVDALWESDRHLLSFPTSTPDQVDCQLGKVVADLVHNGDTVQLGTGGTIDALAVELQSKENLGLHTEVFSDAAMSLLQCGAINNKKKTINQGLSITSFSVGSQALYDYLDNNPSIMHKLVRYTNNVNTLAAHDNMTSINASLEVDLTGQCCSETIGTRHYSGSGGQADTSIGAQMAKNGKSIIALRSTYTDKQGRVQSRIKPILTPGAVVTLTRTNVHYVATEYGAVCLRGLAVPQRAKALISIAHPDFRSWLEEEFQRLYYR